MARTLVTDTIRPGSASDDIDIQDGSSTSKLLYDQSDDQWEFPINIAMATAKGIDFSADSKGVFKGVECIIYRMVSNSSTASETPLGPNGAADWEIASEFENESPLGGAGVVAQNNGIFTFGSTGYWDVTFHIAANDPSTTSSQAFTYLQSETGTGYTNIARAHHGVFLTGGYGSGSASAILKVESTDDTVQLSYSNGSGSCYIMGNTSYSTTHIKFTKLADL